MFWNASAINNYPVEAIDGPVGTVSDFLFDDTDWQVRWLVVDSGDWLVERKVILPASALGHPDAARRTFSVKLPRKIIEESPSIGPDQSISQQAQAGLYAHYGMSPYNSASYLAEYSAPYGSTPFPVSGTQEQIRKITDDERDRNNPSLRSFALLNGYHVESRDGDIGHVEDFLVDDADWSIRFLVIGTRNWWPGKRVLISPKSVLQIDWQGKMITLDVDRQQVKDGPAYDPSATISPSFTHAFHQHYGLTPPPTEN